MRKEHSFITFWKWVQYLFIVLGIIGLLFVIFLKPINIPFELSTFEIILLLIICVLICPTILWGIKNKHPEGYYASWVFISVFIFIAVHNFIYWISQANLLAAFIEPVWRMIIGFYFAYKMYKTRDYYGIK